MFNKYYADELTFLREMGREFAQTYPDAAHFLGEKGGDPDVERLLEGVAFLTARIRQKLDDEFPEFMQALVQMLWPHYLRPLPSLCIVKFDPLPQAAKQMHVVPAGVTLDSSPVDGTPCRFRTCGEVSLAPVTLEHLELRTAAPPALKLKFKVNESVSLAKLGVKSLRLYLNGDGARELYLALNRYLKNVAVVGGPSLGLAVTPCGLDPDQALFPYPPHAFSGFRLLQEYFCFPEKFLFVDVHGIDRVGDAREFELAFELTRLPRVVPTLTKDHVLLNCVPAVNLFRHDADPIRVEQDRVEHRVRPSGRDPRHYEIYSIDRVTGVVPGASKPLEYLPFNSFRHAVDPTRRDAVYYRTRLHPSPSSPGAETMISFHTPDNAGAIPGSQTISMELTSTNRQLPTQMRLGDLSVATDTSPVFAKFRNITRPTPSFPAPVGGDLYWRLISHMSMTYASMSRPETLRTALGLYNLRALYDRQAERTHQLSMEGLQSVRATPVTRLFRGAPVRGVHTEIEVDEDKFAGEGEVYLFGSILNEFLAAFVTLNAFSQLTLRGKNYGEVHAWTPKIGSRNLL